MKKRIRKKYSIIGNIERFKAVWQEEWDLLSLDDINAAIENQLKAVQRCYNHNGNNNFYE
jgi:hypothetical protein